MLWWLSSKNYPISSQTGSYRNNCSTVLTNLFSFYSGKRSLGYIGHQWLLRRGSPGTGPLIEVSQVNKTTSHPDKWSSQPSDEVKIYNNSNICWSVVWCINCFRERLGEVSCLVQEVNVMDSQDSAHLALLARPELGITFTKLHCWTLTDFSTCVFLDADTLVIRTTCIIWFQFLVKHEICMFLRSSKTVTSFSKGRSFLPHQMLVGQTVLIQAFLFSNLPWQHTVNWLTLPSVKAASTVILFVTH